MQPTAFALNWRRLRLTDEDLSALETLIMANPTAGAVVKGTGGLRKIRFAPPSWHTGKSGAARVCYVHFAVEAAVYLLSIYPKNQQADLSAADREMYRKVIAAIEAGLKALRKD